MLYNAQLQEYPDTIQTFYNYSQDYNVLYCFEDVFSRSLYLLSSATSCGLFMLMDKLLTDDLSQIDHVRLKQQCRLVEKLIENFRKTTIIVRPTLSDKAFAFVSDLLNKANDWADTPENFFHQQAKRLIEAIKSYQIEPEERLRKLVEKSWEDFAIDIFQKRLRELKTQLTI